MGGKVEMKNKIPKYLQMNGVIYMKMPEGIHNSDDTISAVQVKPASIRDPLEINENRVKEMLESSGMRAIEKLI